ncbi:MAG: HlyD family efflux transporter periplasmic adaptor subunit [Bacteroides sp.]|nr:HlyD family efflux transporter periplasmic adaptor subunit [Bacteroides sp.]
MEKNDGNFRSEEFQEILESIPSWVVRRGITLLFCILMGILAGSTWFRYPDQVSVSMILTSDSPVATLTAQTSGRLQELYVSNHQQVKRGDTLGILESNASLSDLLWLKEYITDSNNGRTDTEEPADQKLRTALAQWGEDQVLIAPIDGEVTFHTYWSRGQEITAGETVFHIIPFHHGQLLGKGMLPAEGSDKVKPGQSVQIRFLHLSLEEDGLVLGRVEAVSRVPVTENQQTCYLVDIALPDGLRTNTGKPLPYLPEMRAQADIITEDVSLFARFMRPLRKMWHTPN